MRIARIVMLLALAACAAPADRPTDAPTVGVTGIASAPAGPTVPASPSAEAGIGEHETARVAELLHRGPGFFDVPDPLPDVQRGELIQVAHAETELNARVYQVMYGSTSHQGQTEIAVTGAIYVPTGPPPAGGYRIVAWGPGFNGMGDTCNWARWLGALEGEYATVLPGLLAEGYVVAFTDWEGHGTGSPYLDVVGESGTRSLIDAARAARDLLGSAASDQVVIAGHSLGGYMATQALLFGSDYANGLDIRGMVAIEGGGNSDVDGDRPPDPSVRDVAVTIRGARGYALAYPELRLEDVLTPLGLEMVAAVDETKTPCGAYPEWSAVAETEVTTVNWMDVEPWARRIREHHVSAAGYPVFYVVAGDGDLAEATRAMAEEQCGNGDGVQLRVYEGADHYTVLARAYPDYAAWIHDLFQGAEPPRGCSSV
jgi:pimeloyl-ACP methyl ester carboxylesterase